MNIIDLKNCKLCPNECGVNRFEKTGKCGCGSKILAARASLHHFEEPCISGKNGSGTVFFSGCGMECIYCQNYSVSRNLTGAEITPKRLSEIFRELEAQKAHNINLVSPTHFAPLIMEALDIYKPEIPVVYNTSGYEKAEIIYKLKDYIDIYLTDLKYKDSGVSYELSKRKNYFEEADKAVKAMIETKGRPRFDGEGIMKSGVIIRHLVLPSYVDNSLAVLEHIAANYKDDAVISIMSQYFPIPEVMNNKKLSRVLKPLEYRIVLNKAAQSGIETGYIQELSSGTSEFVPQFDYTGIIY